MSDRRSHIRGHRETAQAGAGDRTSRAALWREIGAGRRALDEREA